MFFVLAAATAFSLSGGGSAPSLIGYDPFSTAGAEHSVAVGPVVATNGIATVAVYQIGRFTGDAAQGMAYSTSFNNGSSWSEGWLPGLTKEQSASNPYDRTTYETIAYSQRFHEFLVSTLPILNAPNAASQAAGDSDTTLPPVVNRSSDGVKWSGPQAVSSGAGEIRPEKNWIACDNSYTSRYYGNCYVVWDDNDNDDAFHAAVSTDGGTTWGPTLSSANNHSSFGGDPVILPNGTVVVPAEDSSGYDGTEANIISFVSTNGGGSWSAAYEVSPIATHTVAGGLRTQSLPTTGVDAYGNVYAVWQDCRFRSNCSSNDLVESVSQNGFSWSTPQRIPLGTVTDGADHFLPALAVKSSLIGGSIGISYYGYPQANCTTSCALYAYYSTWTIGSGSWSAPTALAGPFNPAWFAATGAGYMLGDYFESTYTSSGYLAPITSAVAPSGSTYSEAVYAAQPSSGRFGSFAQKSRESVAAVTQAQIVSAAGKRFTPPAANPARLAPLSKHRHTHHAM
jgi:hypothetical protein